MSRWPTVPLGELCDSGITKLGRGDVISRRDIAADPGPYPIYSSARENQGKFGEYGKYMFDEEMITWSIDGGGRLFYRPRHKFSVTNVGGTLRVLDGTKLDCRYLFFVLADLHSRHVFDWVAKAHPSIIRNVYDKIPLPPLEEQKRIVALLDATFAKITAAEEKQKAVARNAVELFNSISSNRLTSNFDTPTVLLGDISSISYGYTESAKTEAVGPKFLRITDIQDGSVDWSKVPYCIIDDERLQRHALNHGDIVFARTGATTGKSFLIVDPPVAVSASYLIRVQPNAAVINSQFMNFYFRTGGYWSKIQAGVSGSTQPGFNASKLAALKIPRPSLEEQKRIVAFLDAAKEHSDKITLNAARALECLIEVKAAVLCRAFEGGL